MTGLESGVVTSVDTRQVRSQVTADAAAGDQALEVNDNADFSVGDQVMVTAADATTGDIYVITAVDPDTGITVTPGLSAAAPTESWVALYPPQHETIAMVRMASSGEVQPCVVTYTLTDAIATGIRDEETAETVRVVSIGDTNYVVDLVAQTAVRRSPNAFAHKTATTSWADNTWATLTALTVDDITDVEYLDNGVFLIQTPGFYDCRIGATFDNNSSGARAVRMHYVVGGAPVDSRFFKIPALGTTGIETAQVKYLQAGDTVEFQAWQNSGAALNLFGVVGGVTTTDCSILRVSP